MQRIVFASLSRTPVSTATSGPVLPVRAFHRQATSIFDQDDLAEARKWHASFNESSLPKGQTVYSRSSGPGGQHVNKTESKATTSWSLDELCKSLPNLMHAAIRTSRYYTKRNDSITIHAQTQRSKFRNTEENRIKLVEELRKLYKEHIPGETSPKKIKRLEALEKSFRANRLKSKKQHSSKKSFRKGFDE
ncbi:hypothetical protein F4779DRAFT_279736 [Xylariaceae sp. FL0662B]|nr:hypothetical protein F4779DRAFT_279736 [Xylariaceae sp. FL0662B]